VRHKWQHGNKGNVQGEVYDGGHFPANCYSYRIRKWNRAIINSHGMIWADYPRSNFLSIDTRAHITDICKLIQINDKTILKSLAINRNSNNPGGDNGSTCGKKGYFTWNKNISCTAYTTIATATSN
jgi:hypothetical protein